jgi:hypothetical protein
LGSKLVDETAERLDPGAPILRERVHQRGEPARRIPPSHPKVSLETTRHEIVLAPEVAQERRSTSLRCLAQGADGRQPEARYPAQRRNPLAERSGKVAVYSR